MIFFVFVEKNTLEFFFIFLLDSLIKLNRSNSVTLPKYFFDPWPLVDEEN